MTGNPTEYEPCENDGNDKGDHYRMGWRVEVDGEIHHLCTKCCDLAKFRGAHVRSAGGCMKNQESK